jgi:hypothetical protein
MARFDNGSYGGQHGRAGRDWKKISIIGGVSLVAIVLVAVVAFAAGSRSRTTGPAALASPSSSPSPNKNTATPTVVTPAPAGRETAPPPTRRTPPAPTTKNHAPPLTATVPNVVGKDLQSAQEELFPPLRSTSIDATGRGRVQLLDSNWVVVRQEPAAGTTVPVFTDIKLFVVKRGESAR